MEKYFLPTGYRENHFARAVSTPVRWTPGSAFLSVLFQQPVYRWAGKLAEPMGAFVSTVLDVGCGTAEKLNRYMPAKVKFTGIDRKDAITYCRDHHARGDYAVVDLDNDPKPLGREFDMVICANVIQDARDPVALLDYIKQHTKPGGQLFISTPDRDALRGVGNRRSTNRRHVREWSKDEFLALLRANGWHVAMVRHFPLVGWWPLNHLAPYYWLRQTLKGLPTRPNLAVYAVLPEGAAHRDLLDCLAQKK